MATNDAVTYFTCSCISWHWEVLFQKRVRGFHQVSKHEKTFETFYCFQSFGNLRKPEAQVFEMTSPKKQYKIMQCCLFSIFL